VDLYLFWASLQSRGGENLRRTQKCIFLFGSSWYWRLLIAHLGIRRTFQTSVGKLRGERNDGRELNVSTDY
jgi:hypothetical protein